uniref:Splicing factor U2AF 65 kDa subunit n=1 Tax=Arundo donax TaxID=35708 RepID=A0A0A9EUP9_ARUDO
MQMWMARPRQIQGCTGGSLAGTRWSPCSTLRTSSLLRSMTDKNQKPIRSWSCTAQCGFYLLV